MKDKKLTSGQRNVLRLIVKGADADGWATVSKAVLPIVETMPKELVELKTTPTGTELKTTPLGTGGLAKLTTTGQQVIDAMEWL